MKKLLIIFLILFSTLVSAEFSAENGFSWLITHSSNGSYDNTIPTASYATLALKNTGLEQDANKGLNWIKSQKRQGYFCFPSTTCKTIDTAFAALVLEANNLETSRIQDWLIDSQSAYSRGAGTWTLQIITSNTGTCTISYYKNNQPRQHTINVNKGNITSSSCNNPTTFFNIGNCLETNLISSTPSLELDIDCSSLTNVIMAVYYQSSNTFYRIAEGYSPRSTLIINNGCFGTEYRTSCNKQSTLYVNWILNKIQRTPTSLAWLKDNYDRSNVEYVSLMYLITNDNIYITDLKYLQSSDGSFRRSIRDTSLAILALKQAGASDELNKAVDWLKRMQLADGSWNNNIFNTAIALYSAFSDQTITIPECFASQTKPCPLQHGVCEDSYETCIDGSFIGCDNTVYSSHNTHYELDELTCDGFDNDCDGSIDESCECITGTAQNCSTQYGICINSYETCTNGTWPGCDFSNISNYEEYEITCNDSLDNDCDDKIDLTDSDCEKPHECTGEDECQSDSDCKTNEECDLDACTCQLIETHAECTSDYDCFSGFKCEEGECVPIEKPSEECTIDTECTTGFKCEDGKCVLETKCTSDSDCPLDYECKDGECTPIKKEGCTSDSDCPTDQKCEQGNCVEKPTTSLWWIFIIFLIILLAILAYFYYTQFYKKPKKPERGFFEEINIPSKPSSKPSINIPRIKPSQIKRKKSKIEEELEKSIQEAKKLFKK